MQYLAPPRVPEITLPKFKQLPTELQIIIFECASIPCLEEIRNSGIYAVFVVEGDVLDSGSARATKTLFSVSNPDWTNMSEESNFRAPLQA